MSKTFGTATHTSRSSCNAFRNSNAFHMRHATAARRVAVVKSTSQDPIFALHIGETTVQVPFSPSAAQGLRESFGSLLKTFSEKQKVTGPKRWELMEYRYYAPEGNRGVASFEVCCNPNAYPTAVEAKMLVTIKTTDGVQIATEGRLSTFKSDFEAYLRERKAEAAAAGKA